ncbi:RHS repeat-associated core domain-containing protein [Pseudomonas sp. PDM31]|uniref:RHS repeat-associated core domain-containing protein n=1 Tax=Pseudomonas sp. PDM31 TaxID=2854778 RepID=UPI003528B5E5
MSTSSRRTILLATDQQRSVMNALDATQHHHLAYTPYGHRPSENGLLSLLGFNGELPDPMTGHYPLGNGYRQFNPVLMRFNSPDSWSPFGKGGLNAYAYCAGEPVNRNDRSGHMFKPQPKLPLKTNKVSKGGVVHKKSLPVIKEENEPSTAKGSVKVIENPPMPPETSSNSATRVAKKTPKLASHSDPKFRDSLHLKTGNQIPTPPVASTSERFRPPRKRNTETLGGNRDFVILKAAASKPPAPDTQITHIRNA